ncbi:outer membrane beta-barrel protein [Leeuwenhoekiella nanhaiensis]|uniref:Outer membrane protein beta-barrel domain-containing protein n=1 Tax=Leeuwenhoekiella nanhaiensis TaxID=1655491 RepID=A0A2G1VW17_9FLAO|nr:outer membrane beta-barrel protein [Leeuwenhoekiella nanhaiensis]PHQ30800.1 hypothetical protein CJ305_00800 [Leeuwenhoekiella nanhaiensis]
MKEKKNIDRLFQEKFKDFEAQPGPHVWESIAAREKQKRKRVIPLWMKLGGVAAVLALLLFAGNFVFDTQHTGSPKLVQEEPSKDTDASGESTNSPTEVAAEQTPNQRTEDESTDSVSGQSNAVASEEIRTEQEEQVSSNSKASGESQFANANRPKTNTPAPYQPSDNSKSNDAVAFSQSGNNKPQNAVNNTNNTETSNSKSSDAGLNTETNTTQDAVAATTQEQEKDQETAKDPDELLRLANREEAIADTNTEDPETQKANRWGIAPLVAPVYYGDFGGSGIDPQFADNAKRGDVNLSYGVQVSYALNDKLKLRAGVNRVDLGYRTEQVAFTPSIQASSLRSIDYNKSASQVQVSTFSNRMNTANSIPNAPAAEEFSSAFIMNTSESSSTLRQQLGYIEVPLEAEYALVDNKFGMQIIGGFSTLFLNNDSVILEEGSRFSTELGSSNSLNNTSFSTNIGLGFDYRITPAIEFNLEPMFKYQLNAYTKGVSDFKPYYMGLYTGINLRF